MPTSTCSSPWSRRAWSTFAADRYRMLETIREYAAELLAASADADDDPVSAMRDGWRPSRNGQSARLEEADQDVWLDRLVEEHDDIRAALAWSIGRADADLALTIAGSTATFWWIKGHWTEGRRWLSSALSLPASRDEDAAEPGRSRALPTLTCGSGTTAQAAPRAEESLAISRRLGDERGVARALRVLGLIAWGRGDVATVREPHGRQRDRGPRRRRPIGPSRWPSAISATWRSKKATSTRPRRDSPRPSSWRSGTATCEARPSSWRTSPSPDSGRGTKPSARESLTSSLPHGPPARVPRGRRPPNLIGAAAIAAGQDAGARGRPRCCGRSRANSSARRAAASTAAKHDSGRRPRPTIDAPDRADVVRDRPGSVGRSSDPDDARRTRARCSCPATAPQAAVSVVAGDCPRQSL